MPPPDLTQPITDIVFGWAAHAPEKTAIVYNDGPISYGAFARGIAMARGFFARRGYVGPGMAVLAIKNMKDMWIVSLALRSLGLTTMAVPSPATILELEPPDARCVVTSAAEIWPDLEDACAAASLPLVSAALRGEAPLPLDAAPAFAPGGHILLTSGTTGVHKMVLFDPSFEPAFMLDRTQAYGMTQDIVNNLFDFPAWTGGGYKGTVCTFTVGATVVIDQRPERFRTLLYPGVTHSLIIPAMLESLLAAPPGTLPPSDRMRLAVTGGALTQRQIDLIRTRVTPNITNSYGATETGPIGITTLEVVEDLRWHNLVCEVQLVDDSDRPVAMGQVGRVRVSTANGPTSYLNDEDATRAFFKDGYFYTGDLGVMRSDGRMALQGRVTDVIIINGHKIAPAPIEERIREGLGVDGVCLFSRPNDAGEEQMHVVIETPAAIPVERLTEVFSQTLWGYPRAEVHFTANLPRNAMGKVLRLAAQQQALGFAS